MRPTGYRHDRSRVHAGPSPDATMAGTSPTAAWRCTQSGVEVPHRHCVAPDSCAADWRDDQNAAAMEKEDAGDHRAAVPAMRGPHPFVAAVGQLLPPQARTPGWGRPTRTR